uniref:Uncharacterized protein n=1 Tax=Arundo donax TaxID=35708 RepID=A0A0A9F2A3_ARUDO
MSARSTIVNVRVFFLLGVASSPKMRESTVCLSEKWTTGNTRTRWMTYPILTM